MSTMKTLIIRPADVSLNPIGADSNVADARVSVVYDRDVWVNGQPVPRVPLISTSISTAGLRVPVLVSDDPSITEGAGFVIKVVLETAPRIGQHNDIGTRLARTIQVVTADPDEIPLGSKPNLTPVADPTQYADVMSAIKAAAETKAAAARVEASAAAAKQSAQAAEQASSQAVTLAQNANAGTDQGVAGLIGQAGSQTQAALQSAYASQTDSKKKPVAKDELVFRVDDHGAAADGETPDQAAINALIQSVPDGATVLFTPGANYAINAPIFITQRAGITVDGAGATLTLKPSSISGGYSAITPVGASRGLTIRGFTAVGNGTVSDGLKFFGSGSGVNISDLRVVDNTISGMVNGVSLNADLGGVIDGAIVSGNTIIGCVGTAAGQGYGIHHATGDYSRKSNVRIIGNTLVDCARHAIYNAKGRGVVIAGNIIRDHRRTAIANGATTTYMPAVNVCRSWDVAVTGNVVTDSYGGALLVGGVGDGQYSRNYVVTGNVFSGEMDTQPLVRIGQTAPDVDSFPSGVLLADNIIDGGQMSGGTLVYVDSGKNVRITGNQFRMENATAPATVLRCAGTKESSGTATYSDALLVAGNGFMTGGSAVVTPVRLSGTETTTIRMTFRDNTLTPSGSAGTYFFACSTSITNPNITVSRQSQAGISLAAGTVLAAEQMGDVQVGRFAANGAAPVGKAAAIASPSSDTAGTKAAIDAIRAVLTNAGLTA